MDLFYRLGSSKFASGQMTRQDVSLKVQQLLPLMNCHPHGFVNWTSNDVATLSTHCSLWFPSKSVIW